MAMGAGSQIVVAKMSICFFTSGPLVEILPRDRGCAGHAFYGCHRNSSPVNQRCCSVNVLASKPRDASLAGFSFVSTYLHWSGEE